MTVVFGPVHPIDVDCSKTVEELTSTRALATGAIVNPRLRAQEVSQRVRNPEKESGTLLVVVFVADHHVLL